MWMSILVVSNPPPIARPNGYTAADIQCWLVTYASVSSVCTCSLDNTVSSLCLCFMSTTRKELGVCHSVVLRTVFLFMLAVTSRNKAASFPHQQAWRFRCVCVKQIAVSTFCSLYFGWRLKFWRLSAFFGGIIVSFYLALSYKRRVFFKLLIAI